MNYAIRYLRSESGSSYRVVVVLGALDVQHARDTVTLAYSLSPTALSYLAVERCAEGAVLGADIIDLRRPAPAPVIPRLPRRPVPAKRRVAA